MTDILYVSKMKANLLLIKALNKKKYEIRFVKEKVRIIDLISETMMIMRNTKNDLYQLTKTIIDNAFCFKESRFYKIIQNFSEMQTNSFQRMHERLKYINAYRL